jgi:hypothetical protein
MAWVRDGAPPDQIKVTFLVSSKDHPDLARFILSLPYGKTSKILREILSSAVMEANRAMAGENHDHQPEGEGAQKPQHIVVDAQENKPEGDHTPGANEVSEAAAGIIKNFDKMFL